MHETHQDLYTSRERVDKCYALHFLIIYINLKKIKRKKKHKLWSFFENLKDSVVDSYLAVALTCQVLFDLYVHMQYTYFMFISIESNKFLENFHAKIKWIMVFGFLCGLLRL